MDEIVLTIAIPTYQRPKYLVYAIDSAVNQIGCQLKYEILVINNDPNTDLTDIANRYKNKEIPIRFISNKINLGMIGNVNKCVSEAKGKYISFLHDDDLLLPNYIKEIQEILWEKDISCLIPKRYLYFEGQKNSATEIKKKRKEKLGSIINIFRKKKILIELNVEDNIYSWTNCYCAPSCGVVFSKKDVKECGLFFPENTLAWDFISFLKMNDKKNIYIFNKPLSVYRISVGLTQKALTQLDFYRAYDNFLTYAKSNRICEEFINKYYKNIKYLNYKTLTKDGAELVMKNYDDVITSPINKINYLFLMIKRIIYFYKNELNVELIINENLKKHIKNAEEV